MSSQRRSEIMRRRWAEMSDEDRQAFQQKAQTAAAVERARQGRIPEEMHELMGQVKDFRKWILCGRSPERMCFAVCAPLVSYLSFGGWECELIEGEVCVEQDAGRQQHFWIEIGTVIVDPTASQFLTPAGKGMPLVYIGPRPSWYLTEK